MKGTQEMHGKTRNNSKVVLHFVAIVLTVVTIVSLALGLFAWSKYTANQSGNATAPVAKWNFNLSLKSGGTSVSGNNSLDLATTLDEPATHVANGKIAPGTSGTFDIEIDTRGTEVAMLYDVTIAMSNCPRNITFSKKGPGESDFTVISSVKTGDETERVRTVNFSKYLTLNDVTTANTNNTKFVETIKWDWPYELTGNDPATNQPYDETQKRNYDLRDNADQGKTVIINITALGEEMNAMPVAALSKSNYGQYVDLGTNILDLENVTLYDNKNYEHPSADWRVFYKDSNGVWLILADYMPNSAFDVTTVGLEKGTGDKAVYGVSTTVDRNTFVNGLKGTIEGKADWSGLINEGTLYKNGNKIDSGIQVQGTLDLETWVASWNERIKNPKIYIKEGYKMGDGCLGYYMGTTSNPTTYNCRTTCMDTLFMPHYRENVNSCGGYWLATPSLPYNYGMIYINNDSGINYDGYSVYWSGVSSFSYGVRPVVYLPNNIKLDTSNTVWTIAE